MIRSVLIQTTLLDILARMKTVGKSTGEILINGKYLDNLEFRFVTGYVEQFDSHDPFQTVRECKVLISM